MIDLISLEREFDARPEEFSSLVNLTADALNAAQKISKENSFDYIYNDDMIKKRDRLKLAVIKKALYLNSSGNFNFVTRKINRSSIEDCEKFIEALWFSFYDIADNKEERRKAAM